MPLVILVILPTSKKHSGNSPKLPLTSQLLYVLPVTYSFTQVCTKEFLCPKRVEFLSSDAKGLKSCMDVQAASLIAGLDTSCFKELDKEPLTELFNLRKKPLEIVLGMTESLWKTSV